MHINTKIYLRAEDAWKIFSQPITKIHKKEFLISEIMGVHWGAVLSTIAPRFDVNLQNFKKIINNSWLISKSRKAKCSPLSFLISNVAHFPIDLSVSKILKGHPSYFNSSMIIFSCDCLNIWWLTYLSCVKLLQYDDSIWMRSQAKIIKRSLINFYLKNY